MKMYFAFSILAFQRFSTIQAFKNNSFMFPLQIYLTNWRKYLFLNNYSTY